MGRAHHRVVPAAVGVRRGDPHVAGRGALLLVRHEGGLHRRVLPAVPLLPRSRPLRLPGPVEDQPVPREPRQGDRGQVLERPLALGPLLLPHRDLHPLGHQFRPRGDGALGAALVRGRHVQAAVRPLAGRHDVLLDALVGAPAGNLPEGPQGAPPDPVAQRLWILLSEQHRTLHAPLQLLRRQHDHRPHLRPRPHDGDPVVGLLHQQRHPHPHGLHGAVDPDELDQPAVLPRLPPLPEPRQLLRLLQHPAVLVGLVDGHRQELAALPQGRRRGAAAPQHVARVLRRGGSRHREEAGGGAGEGGRCGGGRREGEGRLGARVVLQVRCRKRGAV